MFPGALGDFLLLAPAIATLRARGVGVELSVSRALRDLACAIFPGAECPAADGALVASLFTNHVRPELAAWLRGATRLDAWLGEPALLVRHARALDVGEVHRHRVERGDGPLHASAGYAAALRVSGPLVLPPAPTAWVGEHTVANDRTRRLVIHPGAGAVPKRSPAATFLRVADEWRRRGGETVVLIGPAEVDLAPVFATSGHAIARGLELRDVARLLASGSWYVGNDSGISHLAGVLRCRGAVLFGPTQPSRWRPLAGALEPFHCGGFADAEIAERVLALLEPLADGYLDTPLGRH
jgi:hypothetical protein